MKQKNDESNKQKIIRFSIVFALVVMVGYLLVTRSNDVPVVIEDKPPLATALTHAYTSFPVVVLVRQENDKAYLIFYRINKTEDYKFEQLVAKEIKSYPTDIASPKNGEIGVWLKFDQEWVYYNEILQSQNKAKGEKVPLDKVYSFTNEPIEGGYKINLKDNGKSIWTRKFSTIPHSIQPLTNSQNEWLITFEDDIVIMH